MSGWQLSVCDVEPGRKSPTCVGGTCGADCLRRPCDVLRNGRSSLSHSRIHLHSVYKVYPRGFNRLKLRFDTSLNTCSPRSSNVRDRTSHQSSELPAPLQVYSGVFEQLVGVLRCIRSGGRKRATNLHIGYPLPRSSPPFIFLLNPHLPSLSPLRLLDGLWVKIPVQ